MPPGSKTLIEGGVGTAFGCTLQGHVEPAEVLRLMQALLDAGADRVSLADTVGYADPRMVRDLFEQALRIAGDRFCCGHFHDTRGLAMANVYAALEVGVARFDASLAGIGGCPHAPGASGNAATEDLAYMLASMGVRHRHRPATRCSRCAPRSPAGSPAKRCTARCGAPACPRPFNCRSRRDRGVRTTA